MHPPPNYQAGDLVWQASRDAQRGRRGLAGVMRKKAVVKLVIGAIAAGLIYRFWSHTLAYVVAGIAVTMLLLALASPTGAYAALEAGLQRFGDLVGVVVTYLLLVPLFALFFTPLGVVRRIAGRDRMKREWKRDAATYWEDHDASAQSYDRQY